MEKLFVVIFFSVMSVRACAVDGVSVEYGQGNNARVVRLGMLWNWEKSWLNDGDWHVTGFWEAALGRWRGDMPADPDNQTITEIGITPVFRFQQKEPSDMAPYLEGGFIGPRLISRAFIYTTRKFGGALQFGSHLGFGVRLGAAHRLELGYRFQHLSNGDTKLPNNGINFNEFHINYLF